MKRIAVYAGTRNVYDLMCCAAKSLLAHTRMDRVVFLIEDDVFPEDLPDVIQTINVSGQTWFDPQGPNYESKWTYMSLIRLALPEIFPDESRVLWLDIDTIVEDDVGDLFDIDMAGNYVAMVREPKRCYFPFRYFNAGVCLMDLDAIRAEGIHLKWIRLINTEPFTAMDQDAINLICQGEILELSPEYNAAGVITQDTAEPIIRHYAGYLRGSGENVFRHYAKEKWRWIT